jgi:hypothetical protein
MHRMSRTFGATAIGSPARRSRRRSRRAEIFQKRIDGAPQHRLSAGLRIFDGYLEDFVPGPAYIANFSDLIVILRPSGGRRKEAPPPPYAHLGAPLPVTPKGLRDTSHLIVRTGCTPTHRTRAPRSLVALFWLGRRHSRGRPVDDSASAGLSRTRPLARAGQQIAVGETVAAVLDPDARTPLRRRWHRVPMGWIQGHTAPAEAREGPRSALNGGLTWIRSRR